MAKQILPSDFKTHLIDQFIESVSEPANTVYYAFIGDHVEDGVQADDIAAPTEKIQDINVQTFRNMILGKRLTSNDFSVMVPRYDWTSGTVYAQYDDNDANLLSKQFYVSVGAGEQADIHIFKCLYNANGAPSTAKPEFNDTGPAEANLFSTDDNFYQTSDGYQWKYMYSVDSDTFDKFATQDYMPVVSNTTVEENALNGSIDVVLVDTHGRFYNNTIASNFSESEIVPADRTKIRLPAGSSTVQNFYANTILHITAGTGVGQYRRITASTANGSGQYVTIESSFSPEPDETSIYEISPEVRITGDGTQTVNAVARAIVNANASNSVHRVEILEQGLNYNFANASVLVGTQGSDSGGSGGELINVESASVRAMIPPPGGHGANSSIELGGRVLGIHAKFSNTENDTVPAENTFSQFGIIRDPLFANVEISFTKRSDANTAGSDGEFIANESVKQFNKKKLFGTFAVNASNTTIESTDSLSLQTELSAGDYLFIVDSAADTFSHFATISSVANDTAIELSSAPSWTGTDTSIYLASPTANAIVNQVVDSDTITLRSCDNTLVSDRLIVGETSQAVANVQTINVNDRLANTAVYDFLAFNQMTKISAASISGSIQHDETITQANSGASAFVHSVDGNDIYVTRVTGRFDTGEAILASNSGATIPAGFSKYNGELDPTSGNIIYLQNDIPVERANSSSEEIRIILEF